MRWGMSGEGTMASGQAGSCTAAPAKYSSKKAPHSATTSSVAGASRMSPAARHRGSRSTMSSRRQSAAPRSRARRSWPA